MRGARPFGGAGLCTKRGEDRPAARRIMGDLPECVDGLPNLCGSEPTVEAAVAAGRHRPVFLDETAVEVAGIDSAFAVALHMHQPLIPAGGPELRAAAVISNLQWMQEHPDRGDNHNAPAFQWCYTRMGEVISQLLAEGTQPRIMLEYSGTLLHGLRRAGLDGVFEALRPLVCDPGLRHAVEWLGCPWGHAVAPSTPVQDYRLHVRAWQHHFAAVFGLEALGRVRGFSPAEMALPNHPDVAYEFVKTLNDCGYQWLLVQEHTVELPDGRPLQRPHLPHRLVCTSSRGAVLRYRESRHAEASPGMGSDRQGEFAEGYGQAPGHRLLYSQLVVPSADVLYKSVPLDDHPHAAALLEATHRTEPRLQTAVVGFYVIVGIPVGPVPGRWEQLLQHQRIGPRPIGHDLRRRDLDGADSSLEEAARRPRVATRGHVHVDDLAELIDRSVDVLPPASDLHIRLVDLPAISYRVPARPSGIAQQRREPHHPPVDRDVIDLGAALSEQFLDIAIGQAEAEVPADGEDDHVRWEAEAGEGGARRDRLAR